MLLIRVENWVQVHIEDPRARDYVRRDYYQAKVRAALANASRADAERRAGTSAYFPDKIMVVFGDEHSPLEVDGFVNPKQCLLFLEVVWHTYHNDTAIARFGADTELQAALTSAMKDLLPEGWEVMIYPRK